MPVKSDKAYTLVEVLVSLLLMLIILLGLLQGMGIYITHNVKNNLRLEAVKIAQDCAENLRNGRDCPNSISRNFRIFSVTFNINSPTYSSLPSGLNNVTITVSYSFKGQNYSYSLYTVIKK